MRFYFVILFLIATGCNQEQTSSYRDVVINKYMKMLDSSGRYDTSDKTYKALKAYIQNDTFSLKQIDSFTVAQTESRSNWNLWDSDIPLPKLNQLHTEEAYRIIHSLQGSPSYEIITIFKIDSSIALHYLFYNKEWSSDKINRINEFSRQIANDQWEKLKDQIQRADFWNLKNERKYRGLDGSDLTVIGYKKKQSHEQYHSVHRWGLSSMNSLFFYVYFSLLDKTERQFMNE